MKKTIYILSLSLITVACGNDQVQTEQKSKLTTLEKISEVIDQPDNQDNSLSPIDTEPQSEQIKEKFEDIKKSNSIQKKDEHSETMLEEVIPITNDLPENSTPIKEIKAENVPPENNYNFHNYEKFNALLKTYVSYVGKVNYKGIKANKNTLATIVKEFEDNTPNSSWSSTQKLTYWINTYNLFTIKLIVDNYPTTSITKITAKPWDKKFITLDGKTYSLNNIENDIIRGRFNEPRIHFAVNCASKSCPILLNKAYTPSNLYALLTSQTKRFLSDNSKNNFDGKEIKISKIFDWYKADFTKKGTVVDFINKYRTTQLNNPKIGYMEYSWDLNE